MFNIIKSSRLPSFVLLTKWRQFVFGSLPFVMEWFCMLNLRFQIKLLGLVISVFWVVAGGWIIYKRISVNETRRVLDSWWAFIRTAGIEGWEARMKSTNGDFNVGAKSNWGWKPNASGREVKVLEVEQSRQIFV